MRYGSRMGTGIIRDLVVGVVFAFGTLSATGCGTLFAPGPDTIPVESSPSGAKVYLDGQHVGQTPMMVTVDRSANTGNIRVEKPGYAPSAVQRSKRFNTIAILNCAGLIWWVVDLATGNHQMFDTTPVLVNLTPEAGATQPAPPAAPAPAPTPVPPAPAPPPATPPTAAPAPPSAAAPAPGPGATAAPGA